MVKAFAIQGCVHGDLNRCYEACQRAIELRGATLRCVCWNGDVQTVRNTEDMRSLACPAKFRAMKDFHYYFEGSRIAPCLTIFVGGNHEASSLLCRLPFGGWVAPNIYFMGRTGSFYIDNCHIAGISGIYKAEDFDMSIHEQSPFSHGSMRSVYHVRAFDQRTLLQLTGRPDVFMSHDWPTRVIQDEEDIERLLKRKPYFRDELYSESLGNPALDDILRSLQPVLWTAAHLHVNFHCCYYHENGRSTRFITHDKPKKEAATSLYYPTEGSLEVGVHTNSFQNISLRSSNPIEDTNPLLEDDNAQEPNSARKRKMSVSADGSWARPVYDAEWLWILKQRIPQMPISARNVRAKEEESVASLPSWLQLMGLARCVDSCLTESPHWTSQVTILQGAGKTRESELIPGAQVLTALRFTLPDWNELKFTEPDEQTSWWIRLVGLPESCNPLVRMKQTPAPSPPPPPPPPPTISAYNTLEEEEESLSL